MRLPLVRFTVSQLLLAVAVVASNCGTLRYFHKCTQNVHGTGPLSWVSYGVSLAGFLPLLNVAWIGTALSVARRFRSFRGGPAMDPRAHPEGFTYFSLHFLVLGFLVSVFMPEAIWSYQETLGPVTRSVEQFWSTLFEQYGDAMPWVVLECLVLGVFFSGPPIFLSWIGGLLARRSATTLSRRRFRAMTCLVSLGFGGVALAIAVTPRPFEELEQKVDFSFQVVDKDTGEPLGSALLRLTDPLDPDSLPPMTLTGANGRAQLTGRFPAVGKRNALQTLGAFDPWGRWLEVSAPLYQVRRIPLPDVVGANLELDLSPLRTIALSKGETPRDAFGDLAGGYTSGSSGFGGSSLEIAADGRFAHIEWGCTGTYLREYGVLKRNGDELETVPIPHPGMESDPEINVPRYRAIKWGKCRYLCTSDDQALWSFCRGALISCLLPHTTTFNEGLARASNPERAQRGLPRLPPTVWVTFLRNEIRHQVEGGNLRLGLESLVPWKCRASRNRQQTTTTPDR